MQERHFNRKQYFDEQGITTAAYVIPYINDIKPITSTLKILEVGCGEGGNMKPFLDMGCEVYGIDILAHQIAIAEGFYADHLNKKNLHLIASDIYKVDSSNLPLFDVIMLRDVIEHIPNQIQFLEFIKTFMAPGGIIFFGFPPWCMPFGGHQQVCKSKVTALMPYYHILPKFLYNGILKLFGELPETIIGLNEVKDTGLSIPVFHRMIKKLNYKIVKETHYLINPNYETKFKLKKRELPKLFQIPYLSDFYTTAVYCIISL